VEARGLLHCWLKTSILRPGLDPFLRRRHSAVQRPPEPHRHPALPLGTILRARATATATHPLLPQTQAAPAPPAPPQRASSSLLESPGPDHYKTPRVSHETRGKPADRVGSSASLKKRQVKEPSATQEQTAALQPRTKAVAKPPTLAHSQGDTHPQAGAGREIGPHLCQGQAEGAETAWSSPQLSPAISLLGRRGKPKSNQNLQHRAFTQCGSSQQTPALPPPPPQGGDHPSARRGARS